jgi:alkanesulfonate monooxygenase SsuD/methylene tetrahydromethanopterin reductase-like flavin-dependent oxidoreductase (luciferase family)
VTLAASTENADAGARAPEVSTYDLDADVRARVDAAKGLWGPDTHVEIVAGSFVIVAVDRKSLLEQAVSLAERALDALFHDQFRQRPDHAVTVALWSRAAGCDA